MLKKMDSLPKKKIAIKVSQNISALSHGAEAHTLQYFIGYLENQYSVSFFGAEVFPSNIEEFSYKGRQMRYFSIMPFFRKFIHIPISVINTLLYVKKEKPDLLLCLGGVYYNGLAIFLAKFFFGTTILVRTAEDHLNHFKFCKSINCYLFHRFVNKNIAKFVLSRADYVLTVGEKSKEYFIKNNLCGSKGIFSSPGPIDRSNFSKKASSKELSKIREKYEINKNSKTIIFAGALSKVKGADLLPDLIRSLEQKKFKSTFFIIGSETKDKGIIRELNTFSKDYKYVRVIKLNPMSHEKLNTFFHISDLLVFLTRLGVGYGQITIEATLSGLPVLALKSGLDSEAFFSDAAVDNISQLSERIVKGEYKLLKLPDNFSDSSIKKSHLKIINTILQS